MFGPLFTILNGIDSCSPSYQEYDYLPPANEVWGKVMFLHLSVILFTGGVCCTGVGAGKGGDSVQGGAVLSRERVLSVIGSGIIIPPSPSRTVPPPGQQAGSTHPTGMLSCFRFEAILPQWWNCLRKRWILDVWLHRCVQRNVLRRRYNCTSMLEHEVNRNSLWVERYFVF